MIKNYDMIESYENQQAVIESKSGHTYKMNWKSRVVEFVTCGAGNLQVECLDMMPESLSITFQPQNSRLEIPLSMDDYNALNHDERLDLKCNCHGFTFSHGMYWVRNDFVPTLLDEEFEEVLSADDLDAGNFDIVCFWKSTANEWIHSCKHLYHLFLHKEGLRRYSAHTSLEDITSIPEYKGSEPHYFRRKQRSCPGICISAVLEKHIEVPGNQVVPYKTLINQLR